MLERQRSMNVSVSPRSLSEVTAWVMTIGFPSLGRRMGPRPAGGPTAVTEDVDVGLHPQRGRCRVAKHAPRDSCCPTSDGRGHGAAGHNWWPPVGGSPTPPTGKPIHTF